MRLSVNGEPREVPSGITIAQLLELLRLERTQVAVEVNANVVRRALHAEHALSDGDQVEIVTFVGGG
ncbi:MAG: sulfur carrier protein ThiS [Myxococcaceae bacterium]